MALAGVVRQWFISAGANGYGQNSSIIEVSGTQMFHQRTREVGRFVVRTGVYSGTVVLELLRLQPTISPDAVTGREFGVRW